MFKTLNVRVFISFSSTTTFLVVLQSQRFVAPAELAFKVQNEKNKKKMASFFSVQSPYNRYLTNREKRKRKPSLYT